jgi:ESF2/ABP1 family protein
MIGKQRKQKEGRHTSHNFKEGWVEFLDKRVARSVAEMLNAQPIGQSKRWKDDVWTMQYLPRFRWDQLSEQVGALLTFHRTLAPLVLVC